MSFCGAEELLDTGISVFFLSVKEKVTVLKGGPAVGKLTVYHIGLALFVGFYNEFMYSDALSWTGGRGRVYGQRAVDARFYRGGGVWD